MKPQHHGRYKQLNSYAALILLSLVLAAVFAYGQPDLERFKLFDRCRPMALAVEDLPDGALDVGLVEDAIRWVAESRLRAEGLYQDYESWLYSPDSALLYVLIAVDKRRGGLVIAVKFRRRLSDSRNDTDGLATTWQSMSYGSAPNGGSLLSSLATHLDNFLAAYLRVNESHCQ